MAAAGSLCPLSLSPMPTPALSAPAPVPPSLLPCLPSLRLLSPAASCPVPAHPLPAPVRRPCAKQSAATPSCSNQPAPLPRVAVHHAHSALKRVASSQVAADDPARLAKCLDGSAPMVKRPAISHESATF